MPLVAGAAGRNLRLPRGQGRGTPAQRGRRRLHALPPRPPHLRAPRRPHCSLRPLRAALGRTLCRWAALRASHPSDEEPTEGDPSDLRIRHTGARARDRDRRRAVGRRREGQDRRPAGAALRPRLPLPRRSQRRPHDRAPTARRTSSSTSRPGSSAARRASSAPAASSTRRSSIEELDDLEARGVSTERRPPLRQRAPDHAVARGHRPGERAPPREAADRHDPPRDRPAYADKAARLGIRVQDLLDPKILRAEDRGRARREELWLERVYGVEPLELEEACSSSYEGYAERLRPYIADTSLLVDRALKDGSASLRGRARHAPRPRSRHVSLRHLVPPPSRAVLPSGSASARRASTRSSASRRRT